MAAAAPSSSPTISSGKNGAPNSTPRPPPPQKKKLSYLEQREYDVIEARIAAADEHLLQARSRVEDPEVAINAAALTDALATLASAQAAHDAIYERWVELTEKIGG